METSTKFGFNLPSRDSDDIADINQISDNFRIIDEIMNETDQTFEPTSTKAASGKAVNEAISGIQPIDENTEFIFDGGDVDGGVSVDIVVDTVLSKTSNNPIANKPVAIKFGEILGAIDTLKNMVHIVESGTSGIWSYRKWSDGTAECWGRSSISGISTTSARGTYYYNSEVTVNYPSGLFSSKPVPNIILSPSVGFAFPSDTTSSGSKDFAQFFIVTPNEEVSDITVYYSIHAIGRWK